MMETNETRRIPSYWIIIRPSGVSSTCFTVQSTPTLRTPPRLSSMAARGAARPHRMWTKVCWEPGGVSRQMSLNISRYLGSNTLLEGCVPVLYAPLHCLRDLLSGLTAVLKPRLRLCMKSSCFLGMQSRGGGPGCTYYTKEGDRDRVAEHSPAYWPEQYSSLTDAWSGCSRVRASAKAVKAGWVPASSPLSRPSDPGSITVLRGKTGRVNIRGPLPGSGRSSESRLSAGP
mmetsp:Transcript_5609/g.15700  ORF Transcript_5609/g.15700 Transcript_5609/m.15700 type:complete len:230 (+) Transcript_5609:1018-1707(+)